MIIHQAATRNRQQHGGHCNRYKQTIGRTNMHAHYCTLFLKTPIKIEASADTLSSAYALFCDSFFCIYLFTYACICMPMYACLYGKLCVKPFAHASCVMGIGKQHTLINGRSGTKLRRIFSFNHGTLRSGRGSICSSCCLFSTPVNY